MNCQQDWCKQSDDEDDNSNDRNTSSVHRTGNAHEAILNSCKFGETMQKAKDIQRKKMEWPKPIKKKKTSSSFHLNIKQTDEEEKAAVEEFLDSRTLDDNQHCLVSIFRDYFKDLGPVGERKHPKPPLPIVLLTGDPGTGKSHCTTTIMELAKQMNARVAHGTSYNGIAIFNVDGYMLCQTLGIHDAMVPHNPKFLGEDALIEFRNKLRMAEMVVLVIDEVSTIDTAIIGMINIQLQELQNNKEDFGGVAILFVGDFNQLGPVKKRFIPQDMMEWAALQKKETTAQNSQPAAVSESQQSMKDNIQKKLKKESHKEAAKSITLHGLHNWKKKSQKKHGQSASS